MSAADATAFGMKLVVDTASRRVLFAEASREAVDYLYSLVGSVAFENATEAGCVFNLYNSVEQLDAAASTLLPKLPSAGHEAKRFFECGYKNGGLSCTQYVAEQQGAVCPSCGREMAAEVPRGSPGAGCSSGENASTIISLMCLLRDDLTVMPVPAAEIAMARSMALYVLSDRVSATALERRTVLLVLGYIEGLAILQASLRSSTVLTDVFLTRGG